MAGPIENLSRKGVRQTYTQKVSATMNWWRRCLIGLTSQLNNFQSGYVITGHPEFMEMSQARKLKLRDIMAAKMEARQAVERLLVEIENFQKLPITLEDERKGRYSAHRRAPKAHPSDPATLE